MPRGECLLAAERVEACLAAGLYSDSSGGAPAYGLASLISVCERQLGARPISFQNVASAMIRVP